MCRRPTSVLLTLALGAVGCVHPILRPKDGLTTMKQATRSVPTDGQAQAAVSSRLLDQPAGNDYLARGLWKDASNPLPHELATLLAANGVRVGVIGGTRPTEFHRLMTSESGVVNPVVKAAAVGRARVLAVNGPMESCEVEVRTALNVEPEGRTFAGAACGLQVTPTAAANGRMTLACELQIQHGERQPFLKPTADGGGFARQDRRPTEAFGTFAWEVTLHRDEVMVVGATDDPAGTLGQAFFLPQAADRARQRVLAVQVSPGAEATAEGGAAKPVSRSPAAQAAGLLARRE